MVSTLVESLESVWIQAGEEVCINYGEGRSNDALLQFYGCVERL